MKHVILLAACILIGYAGNAQAPKTFTASALQQALQNLPDYGRVLYVAAHPDDENTRLLGFLANEKHIATAYLSLTRGDGGQNLIGNEQGIDLGLIRTQELLAARAIDGAQQFFTRAYDFGYSKSPEEALRIWGHDKILSDVVLVIRKFKPDVIITRFPTTGEGGHGHHTASAILAGEAFELAGDRTKFPEQIPLYGTWQPKELYWNTFNFGGRNTTSDDQLKINVGTYNSLLGKSYGELAALSRSQHKSQGFGVPAQRGNSYEYFKKIKSVPGSDSLLKKITGVPTILRADQNFENALSSFIAGGNNTLAMPSAAITAKFLKSGRPAELVDLILARHGIFAEIVSAKKINALGDSITLNVNFVNRGNLKIKSASVLLLGNRINLAVPEQNEYLSVPVTVKLSGISLTQPYWLVEPKNIGSFNVNNLKSLGEAQLPGVVADFTVETDAGTLMYTREIQYKYTDPVQGEIYQSAIITNPITVSFDADNILLQTGKSTVVNVRLQANTNFKEKLSIHLQSKGTVLATRDSVVSMLAGQEVVIPFVLEPNALGTGVHALTATVQTSNSNTTYSNALRTIEYQHIPAIAYHYNDSIKIISNAIATSGKKAAYIQGAGDKVAEAITQLGYEVTVLQEQDITLNTLRQFDVVVTGIRAYNIHPWLSSKNIILMQYVEGGGVLVDQYNTNNFQGTLKAAMGPYPFTVTRNRITNENALVDFVDKNEALLQYPNTISKADFDGWIQERSIYEAGTADERYRKLFSMADDGETSTNGSVLVADYGKGRYVYTGIVFFRQLPAGNVGAYKLFANLLAKPK